MEDDRTVVDYWTPSFEYARERAFPTLAEAEAFIDSVRDTGGWALIKGGYAP